MESEVICGPWRATRLWNDIIRTFHQGIPQKRHWRNVRTVENCFSGAEAVEWLHKHLKRNPNFGADVTKEQTTLLLQKFLRARVIESADGGEQNAEFSTGELYRLVEEAAENLRTPGKKSPTKTEKRKVFGNVGNTPVKHSLSSSAPNVGKKDGSEAWETKSEFGGVQTAKKRSKFTVQMKEDLNRSYFQSLPPNSLIILDNDGTWKNSFVNQLKANLSEAHVSSLSINVSHIIYNMTKVSAKGIVQLAVDRDDLPHWVLSAMKCLANWPKPMRMINGEESTLPNYPAFINDVFNVVKDYFLGLGSPLIPPDLFDIFISAHIKAEAVGARMRCVAPVSRARNSMQTSTPTLATNQRPNFYVMSDTVSDDLLLSNYERVARIRSTQDVLPSSHASTASPAEPSSSSLEASTSIGSSGFIEDHFPPIALNAEMSKTAIMRNFLPPNSCFETAFMNDSPITRIVLQKECDTLHLHRARSQSRGSCYTPIQCGWDTRSIATQTSQEDDEERAKARRQPRWKRSSRQRKSIAVMEFPEAKGLVNPAFQVSPGNPDLKLRSASSLMTTHETVKKQFSSLDDLLDTDRPGLKEKFMHKYCTDHNSHISASGKTKYVADNVILSKAVRKEKKKQREKRERACSVDRISNRRASVAGVGYANLGLDHHSPNSVSSSTLAGDNQRNYYYTSHYNNLTVKTPVNAFDHPPDMHYVRAEPYRQGDDCLTPEGVVSAVDSFKLLALLLPPVSRRKLQLLLKFMKRVSTNSRLNLVEGRSNLSLVLDTFTVAILRPLGLSRYDEELCRKIAKFFIFNYDAVWTPPDSLRREVEEKVYQSLVSKRIEAGEDPYPITFCRRVSTKVYNQEKTSGVRNAMQDLLSQILGSVKLSDKEKCKKLKKFKEAYPDIYRERFPTLDDEPQFMSRKNNLSAMGKWSSLTKLRHAMRI